MHINLEDFHIVYTMYLYVTIEMVCNNYNLYNFTMKRKIEITKQIYNNHYGLAVINKITILFEFLNLLHLFFFNNDMYTACFTYYTFRNRNKEYSMNLIKTP